MTTEGWGDAFGRELVAWMRSTERELGEKTAEQRAQKDDIRRIDEKVERGFSDLKDSQSRAIGSLRAELKTQRDEDMKVIGDQFAAISGHFKAREEAETANRRLLLRVAWAIATFVVLVAIGSTGAQVALTEPRAAAVVQAARTALSQ